MGLGILSGEGAGDRSGDFNSLGVCELWFGDKDFLKTATFHLSEKHSFYGCSQMAVVIRFEHVMVVY